MRRFPTAFVALLAASLSMGMLAREAGSQTAPATARLQDAGRALAGELGCGACHGGTPSPALVRSRAPALGPDGDPLPAEFVFQYLADPQPRRQDLGATRMPDFRLDEAERVALALLLGSDDGSGGALAQARARHPGADAQRGRAIFQALGCAGCHQGVEEGPIQAPDLSREGVRVRPDWLSGYLAEPRSLRGPAHPSAPGARMPDFRLSADEVTALAAWLASQGRPFQSLEDAALTPLQTRRTERFLEDRASCLGCHRVQGRGGAIGPSLEGLALRLQPSFVMEMIADPQRAAPGSPMPHQPMPLREARWLARYLLDLGGSAPPDTPGPSLADPDHPAWLILAAGDGSGADEGAALYARHCAACHGAGGDGQGWNAANLPVPPTAHADAGLMTARVDDALYDGIHAGAWVLDGSSRMPAFGDLLTPGQIRALVDHIRTLCGCQAPAWSRDARRGGD